MEETSGQSQLAEERSAYKEKKRQELSPFPHLFLSQAHLIWITVGDAEVGGWVKNKIFDNLAYSIKLCCWF